MILRWLLTKLLFAGTMFFAAGATGTPGAGGGDGSQGGGEGETSLGWAGDGGSGESGDNSDSAGDGRSDSDSDSDSDLGADDDADLDLSEQDADLSEDLDLEDEKKKAARGVPPELKEALKDKPEVLKSLKNRLLRGDRYESLGQSPEELKGTLDKIETMGGLEGIESESQEWASVMQGFQAGDPKVLDTWFKDNPEGMAKLMPEALKRYADLDQAGWTHEMAKTFIATVEQSGIWTKLNQLEGIEALKGNPEGARLLKEMKDAILSVNQKATTAPAKDKSAEDRKLEEKSVKLKQQEQQLYARSLSAETTPILRKAATQRMTELTKGYKLSTESRVGLLADITAEFNKLCHLDANYQKNALASLQGKETERFKKLFKNQIAMVMQKAARRAWRKYTGISGVGDKQRNDRRAEAGSRRESGGGGMASGGLVNKAPQGPEVDHARMRAEFGSDRADEAFSFGLKDKFGGKRFYYKKGDSKNTYTY